MRGTLLIVLVVAACGSGGGNAPDARGVDAFVPDAAPPACATLGAADCRARIDCAADFCDACDCTATFAACRPVADPATQCPDPGCTPACCHTVAECDSATQECLRPGESPGCGIPNPSPGNCTIDADCNPGTTGEVCDPIPCSSDGNLACTPGCTAGSCAVGEVCDADLRCVSQACDPSTPCPDDFSCTEGFCDRNVCTTDADCVGFCDNGLCYSSLGQCVATPQ